MNPRTTMLFVAGLFVVALFAVATANPRLPFGRQRGEASAADEPVAGLALAASPTAAADASAISATDLWAAYEANAAAADARFKGKTFVVTGTVADVRRDFNGNILLRLGTGEALEKVGATVVSRDGTDYARGQNVSLRCTGRGSMIGAPQLGACRPL